MPKPQQNRNKEILKGPKLTKEQILDRIQAMDMDEIAEFIRQSNEDFREAVNDGCFYRLLSEETLDRVKALENNGEEKYRDYASLRAWLADRLENAKLGVRKGL